MLKHFTYSSSFSTHTGPLTQLSAIPMWPSSCNRLSRAPLAHKQHACKNWEAAAREETDDACTYCKAKKEMAFSFNTVSSAEMYTVVTASLNAQFKAAVIVLYTCVVLHIKAGFASVFGIESLGRGGVELVWLLVMLLDRKALLQWENDEEREGGMVILYFSFLLLYLFMNKGFKRKHPGCRLRLEPARSDR